MNFHEGAMIVQVEDAEGKTMSGLIDEKGEYIVKPTSKTKWINEIIDKKFTFYDGDNYGLMDFNGEIVIRAKYKGMAFLQHDNLLGVVKGDKDAGIIIINEKDEEVSKEEYKSMVAFHGGDCTFAKDNSDNWILINDKGEDQKIPCASRLASQLRGRSLRTCRGCRRQPNMEV